MTLSAYKSGSENALSEAVISYPFSIGGGGLVTKSCLTLATTWIVAHQAPLSMGFPKQEYWSGLPFPSPGDLPDPGIKPMSHAGSFLLCRWILYQLSHQGSPCSGSVSLSIKVKNEMVLFDLLPS